MRTSFLSAVDLVVAFAVVWATYAQIMKLDVSKNLSLLFADTNDGNQVRSQLGMMLMEWCILICVAFSVALLTVVYRLRKCKQQYVQYKGVDTTTQSSKDGLTGG